MEIPSPIFVLLGALSQPLSSRIVKGTHGWLPPLSALFSPSIERFLALPSPNQVLVALFLVHYTHRAVLQPLRSPSASTSLSPRWAWLMTISRKPAVARSVDVSCSVAPEFRFEGFRLLADDPLAQAEWPWLIEQHPELL